jgi:hypothetical protein
MRRWRRRREAGVSGRDRRSDETTREVGIAKSSGGSGMHTNFSNPQKAGIFTVVVLVLAVAAALVIDGFGLGANLFVWASVWSITPVLATLIMLLVVTRDGYSKEG